MVKTIDDHGRFLIVIEPVDDEARELIKKIKELCGLEGTEVKELKGLADIPPIPVAEKTEPTNKAAERTEQAPEQETNTFVPVKDTEICEGLKAYVDACNSIREKKVSPDEKDEVIAKIKRFAENLKKTVPSGKNLHYIIENMSKVFSPRVQENVLNELNLTYDQLVRATDEVIKKAYQIAVA
jgi:hypothetical protein